MLRGQLESPWLVFMLVQEERRSLLRMWLVSFLCLSLYYIITYWAKTKESAMKCSPLTSSRCVEWWNTEKIHSGLYCIATLEMKKGLGLSVKNLSIKFMNHIIKTLLSGRPHHIKEHILHVISKLPSFSMFGQTQTEWQTVKNQKNKRL